VYFYNPTCIFCKALAPQFAAASSQLKAMGNAAVMAKVDAVSTPEGGALAARFSVTSIPALIWFVKGKPQPYLGSHRDSSDLVFWVVTQTDTITRTLTDQVCPAPGLLKSAQATLCILCSAWCCLLRACCCCCLICDVTPFCLTSEL
jgi:thiol-disulfide isomerase/thioredoxin